MHALLLSVLVVGVHAVEKGSWKLTFPPWDDTHATMTGKPELFIPIMGPITVHSCMPNRYMAHRVATSHINRRDATFCPAIAELKNDFELKYDLQDSHASGSGAVVAAINLLEADTKAGNTPGSADAKVKVVLGPNSSPEAAGVYPFLGGAFEIPYVSWAATRGSLGNKEIYKYFFRVVAPDSVTMAVQAGWVSWCGYKKANVLFINDEGLSTGQADDFTKAASVTYGMTVEKFAIPPSGEGGGTLSDKAKDEARLNLISIRDSNVRVVAYYAMNAEIRDVFQLANELNMAQGPGWFWISGDGMTTWVTDKAEQNSRVKQTIHGVVYVVADNPSSYWEPFKEAWRKYMPTMEAPEFTEWPLCYGGEVCEGRDDFYGFDRAGERCLNSWLQESYVAMVSLAVVADRLMVSTGKLPAEMTKGDWYTGLKTLETEPFDCLSGKMQFSEDQQRASDVAFLQIQLDKQDPQMVSKWTASDGYGWIPGATVTWSDGSSTIVVDKTTEVVLPSGIPPKCPPRQAYDIEALSCKACPEGYTALEFDGVAVCACDIGYGKVKETGLCVACSLGTSKSQAGDQACTPCPKGEMSGGNGTINCDACPVGSYTNETGKSACVSCPDGSTTALGRSATPDSCICAEDYYALDGKCTRCSAGAMTNGIGKLNVQACLCHKGQYKPKENPHACLPCKEGMICEHEVNKRVFGSVEVGGIFPAGYELRPILNEYYWSSEDEPLLVFRCASKERCVGGLPGDATACAPNLETRGCSQCIDGWVWNGKECKDCSDFETSKVLFPVIPILLMPCIVIFLYKMFGDTYERWGSAQNGTAAIVFILLNHYQVITILRGADMVFPENVGSFMKSFRVTSDVSSMFQPGCAGFADMKSALIVKSLGPAGVAVVFCATWGVSQIVGKVTGKPFLAMEIDRTLNGFFSLMFTFFAGIVELALMLFKCGKNTADNDKRTLIADRGVICYEDEWNGMLVIGILAVLFWCVGFGGLFVRTVYVAPQWFHDKGAQMRWKFLFIKYRADVHWWSLAFIAKGIMLNLGFLFLNTGVAQIYWVMTIVVVYTFNVSYFMPWRHMYVNCIDIWIHLCLLLVGSAMTWFARNAMEDLSILDEDMASIIIAFTILCIPLAFPIVVFMFWSQYSAAGKQRTKQRIILTHASIAKIAEAEVADFEGFMQGLSEWDFHFMVHAQKVILCEYAGQRSRSGLSSHHLSKDKIDAQKIAEETKRTCEVNRASRSANTGTTDGFTMLVV